MLIKTQKFLLQRRLSADSTSVERLSIGDLVRAIDCSFSLGTIIHLTKGSNDVYVLWSKSPWYVENPPKAHACVK